MRYCESEHYRGRAVAPVTTGAGATSYFDPGVPIAVMAALEVWTLRVHVAAGVVALLAGGVALATTKGGRRHRRAGRVFVGSMAVVVGTVFPLLALDPTTDRIFLALVAVFSGYLAFSGYRVLSRKRPTDEAGAADWVGAAGVILACLALGGWGVNRVLGGDTFGVVMAAFGTIGLAFGAVDVRTFRADDPGEEWTVVHLTRMLGALIATVTAVSAVNLAAVPWVPEAVAWLWPTAVGVPLIAYWANEYGRE